MEPIELLERYLNNELPPEERRHLEEDLRRNADLQRLLDGLSVGRRAVELGSIRADVRQAHAEFMAWRTREVPPEAEGPTVDRPVIPLGGRTEGRVVPLRWGLRIAASVLLLLLGLAGYQVATLDGPELFDDAFLSYQLPTTRGTAAEPSPLEAPYRAGDFAGVVRQARSLRAPTVPDQFLEALARLQLGEYAAAAALLERAGENSRSFANPLFKPEIEYYLAMAYLGEGRYDAAAGLLDRIQADPRHPYRDVVQVLNRWKLALLAWWE